MKKITGKKIILSGQSGDGVVIDTNTMEWESWLRFYGK